MPLRQQTFPPSIPSRSTASFPLSKHQLYMCSHNPVTDACRLLVQSHRVRSTDLKHADWNFAAFAVYIYTAHIIPPFTLHWGERECFFSYKIFTMLWVQCLFFFQLPKYHWEQQLLMGTNVFNSWLSLQKWGLIKAFTFNKYIAHTPQLAGIHPHMAISCLHKKQCGN